MKANMIIKRLTAFTAAVMLSLTTVFQCGISVSAEDDTTTYTYRWKQRVFTTITKEEVATAVENGKIDYYYGGDGYPYTDTSKDITYKSDESLISDEIYKYNVTSTEEGGHYIFFGWSDGGSTGSWNIKAGTDGLNLGTAGDTEKYADTDSDGSTYYTVGSVYGFLFYYEAGEHNYSDWKTTDEDGTIIGTCNYDIIYGDNELACGDEKTHTHTNAESISSNETYHWYACTDDDCPIDGTDVSLFGGYGEHSCDDWTVTKKATEDTEGERQKICEVCGYVMETETIEKLTHTADTDAGLQKDDTYHWYKCVNADCENEIDKAEHTYGDWTVTTEATETTEGTRERTCTVCGYVITEAIDKLTHTADTDAGLQKDGTYHWYKCVNVGCENEVDKAEHTYGDWTVTTEATETTEGTRERTCTVCGYVREEAIDKLTHTSHTADTEAGIQSDSTGHWYECTNDDCDDEVDKSAHSYIWTVTKEATSTEEGSKTGECSVCGYTTTEAIEKLASDTTSDVYSASLNIASIGGRAYLSDYSPTSGEIVTVYAYPSTGYALGGIYVNGEKIDGTSFVMPSEDVSVSVRFTEDYTAYYAAAFAHSYVFCYTSDGEKISVSSDRRKSSSGTITVKLGDEYAGRTAVLYSGRNSKKNKLEEITLDENGSYTFELGTGKNYSLVLTD